MSCRLQKKRDKFGSVTVLTNLWTSFTHTFFAYTVNTNSIYKHACCTILTLVYCNNSELIMQALKKAKKKSLSILCSCHIEMYIMVCVWIFGVVHSWERKREDLSCKWRRTWRVGCCVNVVLCYVRFWSCCYYTYQFDVGKRRSQQWTY